MRRYIGLLLAGMAWIGAAQAATVNIDFGDSANSGARYAGVGGAPDTGTVWTQTWSSYANLPDSFDNATGVSLTLNSGWTGSGTQTAYGTQYFNNLTRDRWYMTGTDTSPEFSLGGLDPAKTYNVYLYATKHSTAFKNTATGASRAAIGWTKAAGPADFHEADTYAAFRGLTGATSYGFTATGITSQGWNLPSTGIYGMVAGIQIQEVASPGSLRQYWTFDEGTGYSAANRVAAGHTALTATYSATDNKPQPATWVTSGLEPKLTSRVTAPSTSAIDLDSANGYDYINGGHLRLATTASSGQVTLSMWLNPDSLLNDSRLFGQTTANASANGGAVRIYDNKLQVWPGSGSWQDLTPAGVLATNQWQHLALVWDRNQVTAYLNGAQQLTATSAFGFDGSANAVDFGLGAKYQSYAGHGFNGQMDDVAIWSRALPAANIANLADGASPLNPVPQRLYQQVVNVDVQGGNSATINYVGLGAANDRAENAFWNLARSGNNWNVQNLKASDGVKTTPVGVTLTGHAGVTDGYAHTTGNTLQGDRVYTLDSVNGGIGNFVINGLNPRREYDIYFYGSEHPTSFTIDGVTQSTSVGGAGSPPIWVEGTDYVVFQGIGYKSSISGTYMRAPGGTANGALPGFQVAMHLPRQVVNIDIQRPENPLYDGLGAAPDASLHTHWNAMNVSGSSAASVTNLLASDGSTATGFTVSVTGHHGTTGGDPSISGNTLQGDRVWDTTSDHPAYEGSDGIGEFTISGLDPGHSYDVYLYASQWGTEFTFDGRTKTAIGGFAGGQAGGWQHPTNPGPPVWLENTHYVLFEDVTAAGTLTGTFQVRAGETWANLSGIQIAVYIPEPSSFLLLTLALMGLSLRRHRPKQTPRS